MIYIFPEKFEKLKIISPRVKTQPFQFGPTNVTCVTLVPVSHSIFRIGVSLALPNLTDLLEVNLKNVLYHAWGIAVSFEYDF